MQNARVDRKKGRRRAESGKLTRNHATSVLANSLFFHPFSPETGQGKRPKQGKAVEDLRISFLFCIMYRVLAYPYIPSHHASHLQYFPSVLAPGPPLSAHLVKVLVVVGSGSVWTSELSKSCPAVYPSWL